MVGTLQRAVKLPLYLNPQPSRYTIVSSNGAVKSTNPPTGVNVPSISSSLVLGLSPTNYIRCKEGRIVGGGAMHPTAIFCVDDWEIERLFWVSGASSRTKIIFIGDDFSQLPPRIVLFLMFRAEKYARLGEIAPTCFACQSLLNSAYGLFLPPPPPPTPSLWRHLKVLTSSIKGKPWKLNYLQNCYFTLSRRTLTL